MSAAEVVLEPFAVEGMPEGGNRQRPRARSTVRRWELGIGSSTGDCSREAVHIQASVRLSRPSDVFEYMYYVANWSSSRRR